MLFYLTRRIPNDGYCVIMLCIVFLCLITVIRGMVAFDLVVNRCIQIIQSNGFRICYPNEIVKNIAILAIACLESFPTIFGRFIPKKNRFRVYIRR